MALTGLEIFKLLPKTNCKKCGMPTCLAFAMALAQKRSKLESCPDVSNEGKEKLAAAAAPPMRKIIFGKGDSQVQIGQETVCFRHEEKFHSPAIIAVTASDKLNEQEFRKRIETINSLQFERIGIKIGVQAIAVMNDSGSASNFAQAAAIAGELGKLALILVSQSPQAMQAALAKVGDKNPLLAMATPENALEMAKIAKESKCPLAAKAGSVNALAELTEKIKSTGFEDIVLCPPTGEKGNLRSILFDLSAMRTLALKKAYRPLGYPAISFISGSDEEQVAAAISLVCKYSGIVAVDTIEPHALLPMLTTVMNLFTDPQKPVQVEPKIYSIGETNENSPVMFTTNFSLTYYTVESDVEASRIPSYILVVDTEGTSVLTAYSGDKLSEKTIADAMAKVGLDKIVKHRKLIIPGYVAVLSGKIEEATNWEVLVGPRECSMLPKYLKEVWN